MKQRNSSRSAAATRGCAVDERLDVDDARRCVSRRYHRPRRRRPSCANRRTSVFASAAVSGASSRSWTRRIPGSTLLQHFLPGGRQVESLDAPVAEACMRQNPAFAFHAIEDVANRRAIEIDDLGQSRRVDAGMGADGDERGVLDGGELAAAFLGEVRGGHLVHAPDQVAGQPGEGLPHLLAPGSGRSSAVDSIEIVRILSNAFREVLHVHSACGRTLR